MRLVYSDQPLPDLDDKPSLFLAGPTPRSPEVLSWRPEAIKFLESYNFDGTVYLPERSDWDVKFDYEDQVEWEWTALHSSSVLVFWVPRELQTLPAYTTNVEYGFYLGERQSPVLYGRPDNAPNNKYLDWLYGKVTKLPPYNSLKILMALAAYLSMSVKKTINSHPQLPSKETTMMLADIFTRGFNKGLEDEIRKLKSAELCGND